MNRRTTIAGVVAKLAAHTERLGPDDCWPWRGYIAPNGKHSAMPSVFTIPLSAASSEACGGRRWRHDPLA
jgi:hypothetical protein